MKILRYVFLLLVGCGAEVYAQQQSDIIAAVMDFEARGVSKRDVKALSDRFRTELGNLNVFQIMERNQMEMILKEQGFQQSGACSDASCIVEVGQIIAVNKMISGSVGKVGNIYAVSVKMIDVQTGKIERQASEDCDCPIERVLTRTMKRLAMKLAGMKVKEERGFELQLGESSLFVKSFPAGAKVYIDGVLKDGTTPISFSKLPKGKHTIRVKKDKMVGEREVELVPHEVTRVEITMVLQPTRCQIISTPPEAHVFLNGKYHQQTPRIFQTIQSGTYDLRLFKIGFREISQQVKVAPNEDNVLDFQLDPVGQDMVAKQRKTERKIQGRIKSKKFFKFGTWSLFLGGVATGVGFVMLEQANEAYEEYENEFTSREQAEDLHGRAQGMGTAGVILIDAGAGLGILAFSTYTIGVVLRF